MGMNPYIRIRGCRLLEKMETDPVYSDRLSLINASTFCEIPVTEIRKYQNNQEQSFSSMKGKENDEKTV